MRYLFINSVAGCGSTGRIVAEKARELMQQGHQCLIAYGREIANCEDIPTLSIGGPLNIRLHGLRSRIFDSHGFGSRAATRHFIKQVKVYDPDVIWLHQIHGYYIHVGLLFDYLRTCGKKIYWTLHDCWAITGHCSYFDYIGCDRWESGCFRCPQKREYPATIGLDNCARNYRKKRSLFNGIPNLTIITVSNWLKDRVKRSYLSQYPVEVVHNTVSSKDFQPTGSDFRRRYGLEGKILLLGVANKWERRKGLDDFVSLSRMLDDRFRIVLVGLSRKQVSAMPENILCLPKTNSAKALAEIYTAADVHICAGVEETFGMTVLEAISCGTPVIVYAGTACEEVTKLYGGTAVQWGVQNIYDALMSRFGP